MKRFIIIIAVLALSAQMALGANVSVDGKEFSGGKLIGSVTYVPLRTFAEELSECKLIWDNKSRTADVSGSNLAVKVPVGAAYIECNGRAIYSDTNNIIIEGNTYVPVRAISKALSADVSWNAESKTAEVSSNGERFKTSDEVYNIEELYWLSKIINAESVGEPLKGKIAVGNVVLNRVASDLFPDTIYDVIFDRTAGIQFTPTANGTINREPTDESIIAAKICLEDYRVLNKDTLFFINPEKSKSSWVIDNCTLVASIGKHKFYA